LIYNYLIIILNFKTYISKDISLNRILKQKFGNAIEAIDHLKVIDKNVIKPLFALGTNDLFLCDPTIICDWDGMVAAVHISQLAIYLKAVNHSEITCSPF
jgi:hypothetical protein